VEPFLLKPLLKAKPWGGRNLQRLFGHELPPGEKIGESWVLSARGSDSNLIVSGELSGRTLAEAIAQDPVALLGKGAVEACGTRLPVLAKFLDANELISIQVHPDDSAAAAFGEPDPGKEEVWLVVEARPGASLILGVSRRISCDELISALGHGTYECLNFVQVQPGDLIPIHPGMLHSAGKGIVLFEVSQNSDLTYRIHDWNRGAQGRQFHHDKARKVLLCEPPATVKHNVPRSSPLSTLYEGVHFRLLEATPGEGQVRLEKETFFSVTVLEGSVKLQAQQSALEMQAGWSAFVPAAAGEVVLAGTGRAAVAAPVLSGGHESASHGKTA